MIEPGDEVEAILPFKYDGADVKVGDLLTTLAIKGNGRYGQVAECSTATGEVVLAWVSYGATNNFIEVRKVPPRTNDWENDLELL